MQASKTWHNQLVQEICALKQLKEQLEQAQNQGEKELPKCVKEDEHFRMLMRVVEKQVSIERLQGSFQYQINSQRVTRITYPFHLSCLLLNPLHLSTWFFSSAISSVWLLLHVVQVTIVGFPC